MKGLWFLGIVGLLVWGGGVVEGWRWNSTAAVEEAEESLTGWVNGSSIMEEWNSTVALAESLMGLGNVGANSLMVDLTLISFAASKGAVCLDGSLPGYHLHRGYGKGAHKWLVHLEGGGWCNNRRTCVYSKTTHHGSSDHMEKSIPFTGILSNKLEENPDFYNWNRVKVRYCDGGSFSGEGYDAANKLFFRGQRIWSAAMEELMSKGMRSARQALLSGCSAGGLSAILHCDEFRNLFPGKVRVKCLGDAGLFLDTVDVAGGRSLRTFFDRVVHEHGAAKNLPRSCTAHMDPSLCFFPQNLVADIQTPLFLLNAAYDVWQIYEGICPSSADPHGHWTECKRRHNTCSQSQLNTFLGFRNQMLNIVKGFSKNKKNGVFINSCFAHCQTEKQETWFMKDSPRLSNKRIAKAFGDWYFERSPVNLLDCEYPCDRTCHHIN